jgi:hypothetical protein
VVTCDMTGMGEKEARGHQGASAQWQAMTVGHSLVMLICNNGEQQACKQAGHQSGLYELHAIP